MLPPRGARRRLFRPHIHDGPRHPALAGHQAGLCHRQCRPADADCRHELHAHDLLHRRGPGGPCRGWRGAAGGQGVGHHQRPAVWLDDRPHPLAPWPPPGLSDLWRGSARHRCSSGVDGAPGPQPVGRVPVDRPDLHRVRHAHDPGAAALPGHGCQHDPRLRRAHQPHGLCINGRPAGLFCGQRFHARAGARSPGRPHGLYAGGLVFRAGRGRSHRRGGLARARTGRKCGGTGGAACGCRYPRNVGVGARDLADHAAQPPLPDADGRCNAGAPGPHARAGLARVFRDLPAAGRQGRPAALHGHPAGRGGPLVVHVEARGRPLGKEPGLHPGPGVLRGRAGGAVLGGPG
ncbi:hypothetical protein D3C71_740650 [compost metagenome]